VIDLHFWNEHIPATPLAKHSFAWARHFGQNFAESIDELARFLSSEPGLLDINIVRANMNLDSLSRIAARYGFEITREPVKIWPSQYVHRFGENILYWLLTLACSSGRPRPKKILAKSAADIPFSKGAYHGSRFKQGNKIRKRSAASAPGLRPKSMGGSAEGVGRWSAYPPRLSVIADIAARPSRANSRREQVQQMTCAGSTFFDQLVGALLEAPPLFEVY
jgi:hypothetical protein